MGPILHQFHRAQKPQPGPSSSLLQAPPLRSQLTFHRQTRGSSSLRNSIPPKKKTSFIALSRYFPSTHHKQVPSPGNDRNDSKTKLLLLAAEMFSEWLETSQHHFSPLLVGRRRRIALSSRHTVSSSPRRQLSYPQRTPRFTRDPSSSLSPDQGW